MVLMRGVYISGKILLRAEDYMSVSLSTMPLRVLTHDKIVNISLNLMLQYNKENGLYRYPGR
jgi:hypothetical protein